MMKDAKTGTNLYISADLAVVKELKRKKGIPTVIEYQGRRYVLDHADNRK